MAVSRALRRLLRIRELEEEQNRLALESASGELNRLERALAATYERERQGRRLVESGARSNQLMDRLAGMEETRSAGRHAIALGPRIDAKQEEVAARREEFLAKRVERRQAETLIEETEAREAIDADRRGQQSLDDWYGARQYREDANLESLQPSSAESTAREAEVVDASAEVN
jgi:flagellar biosynthesis chaperone FliJ